MKPSSQKSEDVISFPIQGSPKSSSTTSCLNINLFLEDKSILDTLITDEIKNSEAYKTFIGISTGLNAPKKGRGKAAQGTKDIVVPKKTTTTSKKKQSKRNIVLHDESDESEGEPKNRPSGRKKRTPKAVLEIDAQRAIKASKCERRLQHQSGGSSEGVGLRPEALDELTRKSTDSDEGAGSTDDEEYLLAYKDEKPEDISWQSTNDDESENDDEEYNASIDIEMTDDERTDTDVEDLVKGVAEMNIAEEAEEENTE
ncbi:hypothetical protein Tco_0230873 [Tanacetum coccineum]